MKWKIFYGDGETFSDQDGSGFDAPARNAQAIIVDDPDHGWYCCKTSDFYWYDDNEDLWGAGEIFGLFDYLIEPGPKKVLFGRTLSNTEYAAIMRRVYSDPDLPPKTGFRPGERSEE